MNKRLGLIPLAIFVGIGAYIGFQISQKPQYISAALPPAIAELGFKDVSFPQARTENGALIYSEIALDEDAFSQIGSLTAEYSPFSLSKKLDRVTLKNLVLTGELSEDGVITIAGFEAPENLNPDFSKLPKTLILEDFRLSLLSEKFGGINISGTSQIQNTGSELKMQGDISALQKQISINAKIEGQYNQNGFVDARIEIENGKFDLGPLKATRIAGLILANGENLSSIRTVSEIQAGAMKFYDTPWQNTAITVDTKGNKPKAIVSAKSAGYEGLELSLTIPDIFSPEEFVGQLHADTLGTAVNFLRSQSYISIDDQTVGTLDTLTNITTKFAKQTDFKFQIKDEANNASITGQFSPTEDGMNGEFISTPIPLVNISKQLAGSLELKGSLTHTDDDISGDVEANLQSVSIPFSFMTLSNINATLKITDLKELNSETKKDIQCDIASFKLKKSCKTSLQIRNGQLIANDLKVDAAGLKIFIPKSTANKTLMQFQEVNIGQLLRLFSDKNWSGSGKLDGSATFITENDKLTLERLTLTNNQAGTLKITDPTFFEMLEMEDLEKETMKFALENFHYDFLEIKAEGQFPDKIKVKVFGKGKNPILMQGRPFSLDFEIQPDFSKILKEIASP